jgi:CheY-like chemotaxis protein
MSDSDPPPLLGARVLRTVLEWRPSVVVSDLAMPSMDGFTLLREERSIDPLRQIPAIAISGMTRAKDRAAALAAGFQELVSKPLAPDDLIAVVKRWAR